jgi:predicted amidohydrolase YtcJ
MTEQLARPVTGNGDADAVGLGGDVYRVGAERTWAPAVAVRGDRIVVVGLDGEVPALAGARTRVVKLRGRMLLPGFQDARVHASGGGLERLQCDPTGCHRGFLADLVMLDLNLFSHPVDEITLAEAEMTMVAGQIMYERPREPDSHHLDGSTRPRPRGE